MLPIELEVSTPAKGIVEKILQLQGNFLPRVELYTVSE